MSSELVASAFFWFFQYVCCSDRPSFVLEKTLLAYFMCNVLVFYANIKIICWDNTYIDLVTSFTWKNENIILFWCFTFQSGSCERFLSWEEEGKTKKCFVELLQSVSWVLHSSLLVWSLLYPLPRLLALCCVSEALNSMVILHQTIE